MLFSDLILTPTVCDSVDCGHRLDNNNPVFTFIDLVRTWKELSGVIRVLTIKCKNCSTFLFIEKNAGLQLPAEIGKK